MNELPLWIRENGGAREPYDLELDDWFWSIIDRLKAQPDRGEEILSELDAKELGQFYYAYREATDELYGVYEDEERGWEDEDIHYTSCWVLNQGEEFYISVWNDMRNYPNPEEVEGGDWSGLASDISWKKYQQELCG